MTVVAQREKVTDATVATVGAGHPVGDHEAPGDTTDRYTIVWTLDGGSFEGSLANPHEDATFVYQVDSCGRSRQQCEHLADDNRTAMLTPGAITPTGWRVKQVTQRVTGRVENEGRDNTGQPLFCCRDIFYVDVTPA